MVSERLAQDPRQNGDPVEAIPPSDRTRTFIDTIVAKQKLEFNAPALSATFNRTEGDVDNFRSALIACEQNGDGGAQVTIWDGEVGPEGLPVTDCSRAIVLERESSGAVRITERLLREPVDLEVVLDSLKLIGFLNGAINNPDRYDQRVLSPNDFLQAYDDLLQQPLQPVWRGEVAAA